MTEPIEAVQEPGEMTKIEEENKPDVEESITESIIMDEVK